MSFDFVPYRPKHSKQLLKDLSDLDLQECQENGTTPEEELKASVRVSQEVTTIVDESGKPLAVAGVVPLAKDAALAWIMTTQRFRARPVTVLRVTKAWLERSSWARLYASVPLTNTVSRRWLRRFGWEPQGLRDRVQGAAELLLRRAA